MTNKGKPVLLLVRGPSGSGKTTFAEELKEYLHEHRIMADYFEADQYFIRPDGEYDFNGRMLKNAHEWCLNMVVEESELGHYDLVIAANTFTRHWEMEKYLDLSPEYFDRVIVVRCVNSFKNIHGVPEEKVREMKERMEVFDGELVVDVERIPTVFEIIRDGLKQPFINVKLNM